MRRSSIGMVVALTLIGVASVVYWLRAGNASLAGAWADAESRGTGNVPAISGSEELDRLSVRRSEREEASLPPPGGRSLQGEGDGFDLAAVLPSPKVAEIARRIEKMMLDDEAARTKLVKETKGPRMNIYMFEISRREDYNKYLDDILHKEAKEAGVDAGTLGGAVRQRIKHMDIPEGHRQLVQIRVPLNPGELVSFASFAVRPDVELTGTIQGRNASSGSSMGSEDWRYSRLLDVGNP